MGITDLDIPGLTFWPHPLGTRAHVTFPNGFGLSIVPESDGETCEVAITKNGMLSYDSGLTEDVFRYLTVDSVNDLAVVAANLPTPN
jgi:hypothetical protein